MILDDLLDYTIRTTKSLTANHKTNMMLSKPKAL